VGEDLDGFLRLYTREHRSLAYDHAGTLARLGLTATDAERLEAAIELLYRSGVSHLDDVFGRVTGAIAAARLGGESLVLFTADHGEVMHRDNALFRYTHGYALAPEVLNVPLIVRGPLWGVGRGRYEQVTRSIDVLPTLVGLAGLAPGEARFAGTDLAPAVRGAEPRPDLAALSHTTLLAEVFAADPGFLGPVFARLYPRRDPALIWVGRTTRDAVHKYRNRGDGTFVHEAFDRRADFDETTNLFDPDDPLHAAIGAELVGYKARLEADARAREAVRDAVERMAVDEQLEALRSLGYID
jgi:arylsulfatase A-like enzyme